MCREQKNTEAYECIELGQVELGTVSVEDSQIPLEDSYNYTGNYTGKYQQTSGKLGKIYSQIPDIGGYHTIIQANTNRNRANWAKYTT